jgi:hypothetical protein
MKTKYFTSKGSRLVLLILQLAIVLLCAGYVEYVYYADIHPERQVKKVFTRTDCSILNKRLSEKGSDVKKYRADFLISYNIKGVQYNRWVSGDGLEMLYSKDKAAQEKLAAKFEVGKNYTCWFNPLLPQVAVLVTKHNWNPVVPLLAPIVVGLIALFFFFKNLFQLAGAKRTKAEKSKTKTAKKK